MPTSDTTGFLNQDSDFVLYPPDTTDNLLQPPAQAPRHSERAPATSHTTPNHQLPQAFNGHHYRQNSTQQQPSAYSVSPVQSRYPRGSGIGHGLGSPSTSTSPSLQHNNSPPGQQTHFYINSAPSSLASLPRQSPQARPPVPLFSNSTGSVPQATMANSTFFQDSADMFANDVFDPNADFQTLFDTSINHDNYEPANPLTVSPKDLVYESMSAPPSGAFTDLTTPGTSNLDSPYVSNSKNPSPQFVNKQSFDDEADQWTSLFDDVPEPANDAPVQQYIASPNQQAKPLHVAPKMSRNNSSPGGQSSAQSSHGRHSFTTAGVSKRKSKPLPEIPINDPTDTSEVKRRRNTMAARKSRSKRAEKMDYLADKVTTLEEQVEYWKSLAIRNGHVE